ncbi:methyltransferase domain-containing protein [Kitasatospora viridis]|uniref:PadR family transcriptional regulator n=1 Tax=Kitasatospora viridis TaxID=281105 RepID=A0A561UQG5_9ACTN|nr:methyltransferase domain-containing protein [Kitasatospora viridis]TWG01594.1 PadR family transcriptional regulator [Kitasatospora viridis]
MRTNDAQMLVLSALADGPLHGYGVNATIERMTGNRLGRGSLSSALSRLRDKGLVEQLAGEGRRRPLRLTEDGRATLERELAALAEVTGRMFETAVPDRAGYLDRLAATDPGRTYKELALAALDVRPGQLVLDLGCGPGTDLPAFAAAAGPDGRVIGVDDDPRMVRLAHERTAALPTVEVLRADVHALPLPDGCADRAHTDRLLQHVADVPGVLAQARRVLRPGGRLVAAEPDWDTLALDHPDLEIARGYTRHIADRIVRNSVVGRQLPRLAARQGFTVSQVTPVTTVLRDLRTADQILGLQRNTERAVAAGYLTRVQATSLLTHLAEGPFFAAVTLHVVTAERTD